MVCTWWKTCKWEEEITSDFQIWNLVEVWVRNLQRALQKERESIILFTCKRLLKLSPSWAFNYIIWFYYLILGIWI